MTASVGSAVHVSDDGDIFSVSPYTNAPPYRKKRGVCELCKDTQICCKCYMQYKWDYHGIFLLGHISPPVSSKLGYTSVCRTVQ